MHKGIILISFALAPLCFGCGGSPSPAAGDGGADAGTRIIGQHGHVVDYFSGMPLAGFTVTDGNNTTQTDAAGQFVLPAPMGVKLAPVVTGKDYSQLYLPEATAAGEDVDRGDIPIPSAQSLPVEKSLLNADPSKALVYITLIKTGSCTTLAGGTLTVTSPAGAGVGYFTTSGLPSGSAFVDRTGNRPVAVVYNVPPGKDVEFQIDHTACALAPPNTAVDGAIFTGKVVTAPFEPGDHNSSLVLPVTGR